MDEPLSGSRASTLTLRTRLHPRDLRPEAATPKRLVHAGRHARLVSRGLSPRPRRHPAYVLARLSPRPHRRMGCRPKGGTAHQRYTPATPGATVATTALPERECVQETPRARTS